MTIEADADAEGPSVREDLDGMPSLDHEGPSAASSAEGMERSCAMGLSEATAPAVTFLCTLRGRLRKTRPVPLPALARRPQAARSSARPRPERTDRALAANAGTRAEAPIIVAPGDRVRFSVLGAGQGVIEEVLPRRTALTRARSETGAEHVMLANLDQAVLVFSVGEPAPHFGMLDRYLALCEHAGIAVAICLNKVDLGVPTAVMESAALYASLGYEVLFTSAATRQGVDRLRERLAGRTSLLTGPSGVGKSSLMNDLLPDASQRIREISEATGKGRHTTTGVRLLPLPEGGWLADSAGIRELALWNVPADALAHAFVELRPLAEGCAYDHCEQAPEDAGCALREALTHGRITPERWASFERLLDEARVAEAVAR